MDIIDEIIKKLPGELAYEVRQLIGEDLLNIGKVEEVLKLLFEFEKRDDITTEEKLKCKLGIASIYSRIFLQKYEESIYIAEKVYLSALKLDNYQICVDALILKYGVIHLLGKYIKESEEFEACEKFLNLISGMSKDEIALRKATLLSLKGWNQFLGGNIDSALNDVLKSLELYSKYGNDYNLALCYTQIISLFKSKGELNKALDFEKPALTLKGIPSVSRMLILGQLGEVHTNKGELDQALKYYEEYLERDKKLSLAYPNGLGTFRIGNFYRLKGDFDRALGLTKNNLKWAETDGRTYYITQSLFWLIIMNLDKKSFEEAQNYLKRLEMVVEKEESRLYNQIYRIAKALVLKSSPRSINRGKAESILKKIAEEDVTYHEINTIALISLCDLLLTELRTSNDMSILEEINPYITKLLKNAENQQSYRWIAEINLLKAKISQIELNLADARKFLTKAQNIANEHGLKLLAQKISQEHDKLLEELETWQVFKDTQASVSKRMNLISVDGIIERMIHKRIIDPPELVNEEPILLLIMGRDGISYFNCPFVENWSFDDIFSSFMSAFNSFSSEIFAKNIDRIKIDENIILVMPVDSFLVCYVIKGQSYLALQKLTRFSDAIKWNTEISEALKKSAKTGEELDLNNPASLGVVVNEIFNE